MGLKLGTHTSIAGGIQKCFKRSYDIGGNALQIFSKSPRGWFFTYDKLEQETINQGKNDFVEYNQNYGMIHSVYLINLAKDPNEAQKDVDSVIDDFKIANAFGFSSVNVHLGKYGNMTKYQCFDNMRINLEKILDYAKDTNVNFLFENTAGQGGEVGHEFSELADFYNYLKDNIGKDFVEKNVNFCVDSAHARGAGYDLNDFDNVLEEFDKYLGLDRLYCLHLNDSKVILGSKLDRHASLGRGFIGLPALFKVVDRAVENDRPLLLETPEDDLWADEIDMIRGYVKGTFGNDQIKEFHKNHFATQYLKKFQNYANGDNLFA